jgi:alkylhydroperoxidase family enzyme
MATAIKLVEPTQNEFLADLEKRSNHANHFFRTMANRPDVLKNFVPFYGSIMGSGPVDRRTKELVYLTVSFANKCAYCSAAEEEMLSLQAEQDGAFTAPERAAIEYARELTRTSDGAQTRDALNEHYNDEQIVEITLIAALANFTNRFNNGLDLMPEK